MSHAPHLHAPHLRVTGPPGDLAVADHGGDGPDVVLCHGANRTLLDWERLRPHLTGMRLVSYDLRGHGRSDPPADEDYGWAAHLADLDAVTEALALENPRVIGHSLGGMIALCHGQRRPDCPGVVDLDGLGGGFYRSCTRAWTPRPSRSGAPSSSRHTRRPSRRTSSMPDRPNSPSSGPVRPLPSTAWT